MIAISATSLLVLNAIAQTKEAVQPVSENVQNVAPEKSDISTKWGFITAAFAVGIGSLAGGLAVGYVGAAAMGAIGERPELAGRALIFVGLAEGIAIYGLIIAIMILGKI
ncbi:MAG: ATPase [Candidatus Marinimicrobia bacterium CG08_land_8_20_14_0_20_45_22]|nr:MAG: ATPase [Candidatus Marinimicrobia bacterium CG08_land_8_20_14_0_20_45_22]